MNHFLGASVFIMLLISCHKDKSETSKTADNNSKGKIVNENKITTTDTLIINCDSIFKEKGYYIQLISTFHKGNIFSQNNNSIFLFSYQNKNENYQIISDSLYSRTGQIEFLDYNQDSVKDILIQNTSDSRSNWTYNLYLVNLENRSLKRVEGFNKIKNPRLIESGIIESYISSGTNYFQFYILTSNDTIYQYDMLVNDRHDEKSEEDYRAAIKKIKQHIIN